MTTLTETLPERLALPLAILFALGATWSVVSGAWFFVGGAETDVAVPVVATAPRAAPESARSPLSATQIAALNLFGVPRADDANAAQRIADAPETRLQLALQGVFLADDPDASSVIVAERNRDGKLYRIGDRLPGNAVLVEVLGDRIVLRRAGQLETLKFLDAAPGGAYLADGAASAAPRAAARGAARRSAAGTAGGITSAPAGGSVPGASGSGRRSAQRTAGTSGSANASMRDQLREFGERLNVDPTGTLAEFGVEPVAQGSAGGYRLGSEIPSSTLAKVGLRPGDVVLSVNGQAVGIIQQDRAQLDSIMDAGSARLEIQRGDRRFFVTTRIR